MQNITASMCFSMVPSANFTARSATMNSVISVTCRDELNGSEAGRGAYFVFSEMRMGSLATSDSCMLTSIPEARLPTTITFWIRCQ